MKDFDIKLDGVEYKCSSTSTNGTDKHSWDIQVSHGTIKTIIRIPMDNAVTRAKVLLFIEAFHVAMHKAFEQQQIDQNYIWNQKTSIK